MTETTGNRIWLVCTAHPDMQNGIMLGQRRVSEYFKAPNAGQLNDWFEKHHACDPNPDHFKLAHSQTPNWDKHKAVGEDSVPLAVRLSIVKNDDSSAVACECGCLEFKTGGDGRCVRCGKPSSKLGQL